jgi:general secretion pathway protein A
MYETFFGLKRRPFLFVSDVESYCSVDSIEESRQSVERTIQHGEGISLIFGAAGTGKSLLMRILRQSLESAYTTVLVSHSRLETPKALFLQLAHELDLPRSDGETIELRLLLLDFARKEAPQGIVLLLDEAQFLSPSVLEEIRFLTDSTDGSVPLFRAVLAGTLDFEEKLTMPSLEAFNQRIVSRCYLDSFTGEETCRYITRQTDDLRVDSAHGTTVPLFAEGAKRRIHQLTDGIPRLINQLCSTALQFAAEKERDTVDETLVSDACSSLQHIDPIDEAASADSSAVQESVTSPEEMAEIIDRKRKTFRIRQFDSIEFGTLTDTESDPVGTSRSVPGNDYKPPYPEDDDVAEWESKTEDEVVPVHRTLQLHVPTDADESDLESAMPNNEAIALPKRKMVPNFYKQERKFRRQYLLEKIQHRLGLFAGLHQKTETQQPECPNNESDMNAQTLQKYGAAVLDSRPPFVRKEPHYAYQMPTTPPQSDVTYPDPNTGVPITLRWLPEKTGENERFGVSYTEFLNREKSPKPVAPEKKTELPEVKPVSASLESAVIPQIVRASLNASLGKQEMLSRSSCLEETFEETQQVGDLAISLAELFGTKSSALQQIEALPELKGLDEAVQRQLDAAVQRILKAAEKIERAAEVSEQAGRHVSQTADFVESEVKAALPTYTDLFKQWSEFQELISSELGTLRRQNPEVPQFRTFPRRQVMIERVIPTIDVETLLR